MLLRRATPLALAVAALACEPSVPFDAANNNPPKVDYAGFDPTGNPPSIPLPNDLALLPQAIATQSPAQAALLSQWAQDTCVGGLQGCFPNDQEVPITIDFVTATIDANTGAVTRSMPQLDVASIKACTPSGDCSAANLIVLSVSTLNPLGVAVAYDPPQPTDYVQNGDHGTLTIRKSPDANNGGSRRWPANSLIVVAVRGGTNGPTVTGGAPAGLQPQAAMFLLLQDKDLSLPENEGIIPGANRGEKKTKGAQLEQIRKLYVLPFSAIDRAWGPLGHRQIATMGTFKIADTSKKTHVETDPSAGRLPLPSDFLLDANFHLLASAQAAFGAAGPGLATLDGFSTTGPFIAQFSSPVDKTTITKDTVLLYEIAADFSGATRLKEANEGAGAGYLLQPPGTFQVIGSSQVTTAIVGQPGINITGTPLVLPPLKENTEYGVIVTNGIKDFTGSAPITRSTLGSILLLDPTLHVSVGGKSQIAGLSDSDAAGLEKLRALINGILIPKATADGKLTSRDQVVMAYTFKTQSITGRYAATGKNNVNGAIQIAQGVPNQVLPAVCAAASLDCRKPVAGSTTIVTSNIQTAVFDKYGVDSSVPTGNIGAIIETKIFTFNMLDPATGAFLADPTKGVPEQIDVIIAVPKVSNANLQTCSGPFAALGAAGERCVPLTIFQHGLGGSRTAMLLAADNLVAKGMIVAAIDAPKHGNRTFCSQVNLNSTTGVQISPDLQCVPGTHCVLEPTMLTQDAPVTDANGTVIPGSPGKCRAGTTATAALAPFVSKPTLCIADTSTVPTASSSCTFIAGPNAGFPIASGQYFVGANFFRTRDTARQHMIDITALINVIGLTPAAPPIAGQDVFNALAAPPGSGGFAMIVLPVPSTTSYIGQSLGSLFGSLSVAANPRIGNAVLNVGGGTYVDIFTNAPAFTKQVDALFKSLGIDRSKIATDPATAAKYLQTLLVAKWILDGAEPLNFADAIKNNPLPNLLPPLGGALDGSVAQPAKLTMSQIANCDNTVPNPFNTALAGLIGLQPSTFALTALVPSGFAQWYTFTPAPAVTPGCPGGGGMPHGFLVNWGAGQTGATQAALAGMTSQAQNRAGDFVLLHAAQPTKITETTPYP
jgi:hypothetical protein